MVENHFEGLNEDSYPSLWFKLGEIPITEEIHLPLIVNFNSSRESVSPALGHSWTVPLLETVIVARDEKCFEMIRPDGGQRIFRRANPKDTILRGGGGWMAEIRENGLITVWADCGWKMIYQKGRILSMVNSKNQTIDYVYSGNKVTELRFNGQTRFRVEYASATGEATGFVFGDKRIGIDLGPRPRVLVANGRGEVRGESRSLRRLTFPDGTTREFQYPVNDPNQPGIKMIDRQGEERLITWDAATRRILADRDANNAWKYTITPPANPEDNAAIERTNQLKQTEYWHDDRKAGIETVQGLDGIRRITYHFAKGPLSGKIRKIEEIRDGKRTVVLQRSYSEKGLLLRETTAEGTTIFQHDSAGREIAATRKGQVLWTRQYDPRGRLVLEDYPGQRRIAVRYDENGGSEQSVIPSISSAEPSGVASGTPSWDESRKETWTFDEKRRLSTFAQGTDVKTFHYSNDGRVVETRQNGVLVRMTEYDTQQRRTRLVEYADGGKTIGREQRFVYSPDGLAEDHVNINANGEQELSVRLRFDERKRIVEHTSKSGSYFYSYGTGGERAQRFVSASIKTQPSN